MSAGPNSDPWDADQIRRLVQESGRPLEFRCAKLFMEKGWTVSHGSYFTDVTTGSVREVDLIAGRTVYIDDPDWKEPSEPDDDWDRPEMLACTMGVFLSCKGFREEQVPIMYSHGKPFPETQAPRFMFWKQPDFEVKPRIRLEGMREFFAYGGLDEARRIAVLEMAQRKLVNSPKKFEYSRLGDRDLFEGMDSAFKAALYWQGVSKSDKVYLRVPVLVTSKPWIDVPLDRGEVGAPREGRRGYKTTLYPHQGPREGPELITTLIWCEEDLPALADALNRLHTWFTTKVREHLREKRGG